MTFARHVALCGSVFVLCALFRPAQGASEGFRDDFTGRAEQWTPYFDRGDWSAQDGVLTSKGQAENSARLAPTPPAADVLVDVEVRVAASGRRNFGIVLRAQEDRTCLVVRYYDRKDALELLVYEQGRVRTITDGSGKLDLQPGRWYRLKATAVGGQVLAKIGLATEKEPDWQMGVPCGPTRPGRVGLIAQDAGRIDFRAFRVFPETDVERVRGDLAQQRQARLQRLKETLTLKVEPTPFVLRSPEGPSRRLDVTTLVEGKPEPVPGELTVAFGSTRRSYPLKPADFRGTAWPLRIPEPNEPTELEVRFDAAIGKRLTFRCQVKPARRWTFYMTPHTHYDIGYTHPQPEVIDRLTADMDTAQQYCRETSDWPPESRYRWTIEVSGLMKNYIDRRSKEQVDGLIEWVRSGRIEIGGYYLNMPTELVGHEELIRCLYYARELRCRYGVTIDTAMINDVPGYAWALPPLFREAGIPRVSFRANSIRGQFLWYRPGAVPRPFYWVGPEGSRLFVWYTDSYREGNFFRAPGLHEDAFLRIIRQNEQAGCWVDDVQLRMGGDNLPPDINTSRNARAWNETYVWPRVVVATNREFLETLEHRYGARCEAFQGDIPSWWAEGPASSALETGMNRLVHDQLVAAEALWTLLWLTRPGASYPHEQIRKAYDKMIHFDEHTWGASCSISNPRSQETLQQWQWKAANAYEAKRLTDDLYERALATLCEAIPPTDAPTLAVWNTLPWTRTDVVELSLVGTPLAGTVGLSVVDTRDNRPLPVQMSQDGKSAVFVARDVPPWGYVRFAVRPRADTTSSPIQSPDGVLENASYRVEIDPGRCGVASWYDKELQRELVDAKAPYRLTQAIHETPIGGREAIDRKTPVSFKRTAAGPGRWVAQVRGPVFSEAVIETSLPTCPRIEQRVRLYNELKHLDIVQRVTKQEVYDPEGVYFAFPFAVPAPEIRFQIANATMRPGKDQLPYTCFDFYSIQHLSLIHI